MDEAVFSYTTCADVAEFSSDLLDRRHKGGQKVQELAERKGKGAGHRYLAQAWAKASEKYAEAPPVRDRAEARNRIADLRSLADQSRWKGTSGATDLAVLKAHYLIAWKAGKLAHDASTLDVALLAGVSSKTIPTSHRRLEATGWLHRARRHRKATEAMTWTLVQPAATFPTPSYTPIGVDMCGEDYGHDVWRWKVGLGKAKARLYYLLCSQPRWLEPDLRQAYGKERRTVSTHLSVLQGVGLAERLRDGAWRVGPMSLDEVAKLIGVAGKSEQEAVQFEAKRAAYRAYLAERQGTARQIRDPGTGELLVLDGRTGEVIRSIQPSAVTEEQLDPDRLITDLRAAGMNRFAIAEELNRRGCVSPDGASWTAVTVARADPSYDAGPGEWYMHLHSTGRLRPA